MTFNHGVEGSSPSALTKRFQEVRWLFACYFSAREIHLAHTLHTEAAFRPAFSFVRLANYRRLIYGDAGESSCFVVCCFVLLLSACPVAI